MNDEQIDLLRQAVKRGVVFWISGIEAREVVGIGGHPEEGKDDDGVPYPCAIFANGRYAALYSAELSMFYSAKRLSRTTHTREKSCVRHESSADTKGYGRHVDCRVEVFRSRMAVHSSRILYAEGP